MHVAYVGTGIAQSNDDDPLFELGVLVCWSRAGVQSVEIFHRIVQGVGVVFFDLVRPRMRAIRSLGHVADELVDFFLESCSSL